MTTHLIRLLSALAWVLAAAALSGCTETVRFSVPRAPKVDVAAVAGPGKEPGVLVKGSDMGSPDEREQSALIAKGIEARIRASGGRVRLAAAGAAVGLVVQVDEFRVDERVESKSETCDRSENGKSVRSQCLVAYRYGRASMKARVKAFDAGGKALATEFYVGAREDRTSTDRFGEAAPPIDWKPVLQAFRAEASEAFANVVLPHAIDTQRPWWKCGDVEAACRDGLGQLQAGRFDEAVATFRRAAEQAASSAKREPKATAAPWWGLALALEFKGDLEGAREALKKASEADPGERAFLDEASLVEREIVEKKGGR